MRLADHPVMRPHERNDRTPESANREAGTQVPGWRDLGGVQARGVVTSRFRLDGGSMFGQVPKPLWSRFSKADRENRVPLVVRSLLVRRGGALLLVDPGMGGRYDDGERLRLDVDPRYDSLAATLRASGVVPEEITDVLLTHLHFDHIGGLARAEPGSPGGFAPELPGARLLASRSQWERARAPGPKERRSFRPRDLEVLESLDPLLLDAPQEILPRVFVTPSEGHTRGLLTVRVVGESESLHYPTDLIPLLAHIRLPYTTGFDLWPERLLDEKQAILADAAATGAWIVFAHDPRTAAARVMPGAEGYAVRERLEDF